MIIIDGKKYIKAQFTNESEIENVVINNYEYLFGPSSIYLSKALIKTHEGIGTIPDGFAIDIENKRWYLVEAELIIHSVWSHISPQVTKQMIAAQRLDTKNLLQNMAVSLYQTDDTVREKFDELGIKEINVRKVLTDILNKDPVVGIPIDEISNDLKDWARTLKFNVILWVISKYVNFNSIQDVAYEFPEEFKPELDTEKEKETGIISPPIESYTIRISDLIKQKLLSADQELIMDYKQNKGVKKSYTAIVRQNGNLEVLGTLYSSPSYAAVACIQNAGSLRKTINGWTKWKTKDGRYLDYLRSQMIPKSANLDSSEQEEIDTLM